MSYDIGNNSALLRAVADLADAHPNLPTISVRQDSTDAITWDLASAARLLEAVGGEWEQADSFLHQRTALRGTFAGHPMTVHLQLAWATEDPPAPPVKQLVAELAAHLAPMGVKT